MLSLAIKFYLDLTSSSGHRKDVPDGRLISPVIFEIILVGTGRYKYAG